MEHKPGHGLLYWDPLKWVAKRRSTGRQQRARCAVNGHAKQREMASRFYDFQHAANAGAVIDGPAGRSVGCDRRSVYLRKLSKIAPGCIPRFVPRQGPVAERFEFGWVSRSPSDASSEVVRIARGECHASDPRLDQASE